MTKTIYVVSGSSGRWGDEREWVVCAFESKEAADQLVAAANGLVQMVAPDDVLLPPDAGDRLLALFRECDFPSNMFGGSKSLEELRYGSTPVDFIMSKRVEETS